MEFLKKVEAQRKELINIANFIANKNLKIKSAMFRENQIDYFRGMLKSIVIPS